MITYIYTLTDPITNMVRYIGKTDYIEKRYHAHLNEHRNNTHKEQWIRGLKDKGHLPIIDVIDEVDTSEWVFWEQWWISLFKSWGYKLTNIGIGGEGGPLTEETKMKIRLSKLGNKGRVGKLHSIESKIKMSKSQKNKKQSEDHIINRSKACIKYIDVSLLEIEYNKCSSYDVLSGLFGLSRSKIYRTLKENNILNARKIKNTL